MQHPAVEAGIVGQKGMAAFHEGHELRHSSVKVGASFSMGQVEAMHMGEQNTGGRRTDQAVKLSVTTPSSMRQRPTAHALWAA